MQFEVVLVYSALCIALAQTTILHDRIMEYAQQKSKAFTKREVINQGKFAPSGKEEDKSSKFYFLNHKNMQINSILHGDSFRTQKVLRRYFKSKSEKGARTENATSTATPVTTPPPNFVQFDSELRKKVTEAHNNYRSGISKSASNMRYITWDSELAWISETFTNSCRYRDVVNNRYTNADGSSSTVETQLRRHSTIYTEVGHNWMFLAGHFKVPGDISEVAVKEWTSEKEYFNKEDRTCSGICQHFLQIESAITFKVGCGAQICEGADINSSKWPKGILFVCSYTPRGGATEPTGFSIDADQSLYSTPIKYQEVYKEGDWCSECDNKQGLPSDTINILFDEYSEDTCARKRLCANEERDKDIPFTPPPNTTVYPWFEIITDTLPPTPPSTTNPVLTTTIPPCLTEGNVNDDIDIFAESSTMKFTGNPRVILLLNFCIVIVMCL